MLLLIGVRVKNIHCMYVATVTASRYYHTNICTVAVKAEYKGNIAAVVLHPAH